MEIIKSDLEKITTNKKGYPDDSLLEIAFVGRSNVGKSSFINAFLNRKSLARTSAKPGKTRTINFYIVNDCFRLVDLPGYGYAKVSKSEKDAWGKMIEEYILSRRNLKEIFLIVDIRHKPTELDKMMYEFLIHHGYGTIVIASKCDKISKGQYHKQINEIAKTLEKEDKENIIPFSSLKKYNIDKLRDVVSKVIES